MAGILGYLSILADDIGTLAGKTMATASKSLSTALDDVTLLFDDIATYTKVASIKSTGLVVDDLAAIASFTNETTSDILKKILYDAKNVNEVKKSVENLDDKNKKEVIDELNQIKNNILQEAKRNAAKRELPIVYKIAKGSMKNKFIIIPLVLIMSFVAPWLIGPILILGGIYLAYEGVESILEKLGFHHEEENSLQSENKISIEKLENQKIKSAIKTDFILSFEIIVITLSLVENTDFITKLSVLILIGIISTIAVYGIVAIIIKLDDIGFYLQEKKNTIFKTLGTTLEKSVPTLIKIIGIIGTIAMLAVGGGIIDHQLHLLASLEKYLQALPLSGLTIAISQIILGAIIGYIAIKVYSIIKSPLSKLTKSFKS